MPTLRIKSNRTSEFTLQTSVIGSLTLTARVSFERAIKQFVRLLPVFIVLLFFIISAKSQNPVFVKSYPAGGTAFLVANGQTVPYPGAQVMMHYKSYLIRSDYTRNLISLKTVMLTADADGRFQTTVPCYISSPSYNGTLIVMSAQIVGSSTAASTFSGGNSFCDAPDDEYIYALGPISGPSNEPDRQNYGESCSVGKPVNVTNGNMWLQQADYNLPGVGENIKVDRFYNSLDQQAGLFGFGWTSDYDESISFKYEGYNVSYIILKTDVLGTETYTVNFYYGEVLTKTDRMNGVTTNTYDANGNLLTTKDPLNNTTTLTYTAKGQIATVKDARNNTATLTYDAQGRLTEIKDANNKTTNFGYDARARLTGTTNALNQTTNFEYDLNNRLKKVIYPDTKFEELTYDLAGRRTKVKDARGNETNFAYDNAYRLTSVTDALNHATAFGYDLMSNLTSQTDALNNTTNYEYDSFDRLKKVIYPPATTGATRLEERIEYDAVGNVKKRIDTANRETLYDYDTAHRLIKTTDALNKITQFEYNALSQMTKVKDALNQEYVFTYDALGRTLSQTRAGSTMSYEYDAVGNRTKRTDYTGRVTDYAYDVLNRLTNISYVNQSSANASYSYDDLSRLTSATNNAGTVSFTYDNRNRLKTSTDVFSHVVEYGYDENGNRNLLKFNNTNYATYAYDVANRLTSITNSSDSANITFGYDNADRLTSKVLPNGITTSYSYDGLSRLTRLKDETTSTVLFDRQLSYNSASQISQILEPTLTRNFSYDNVDRLTGVTNGASATIESYAFNEVGSRTSSHLSSSYSYQSNNRLTATQTASYGYNANGAMTSKTISSVTTNYTWDYENRMTSATDGTTTVSYEYDALGRRTKRTQGASVTKFTYDGLDVLVDDNGGTLTKYLNGLGIDSKLRVQTGSSVNYFLTDHLGSTNGLADSTGSLTASTSYDGFGNATNTSFPTRYQYTGREFDSTTGLYYYRARWYDAQLGRFISEDPIGFAGGDINLYGYVRNNATNLRDPSGKVPPLVIGAIVVGGLILASPEYINAPGPGDPVYRPENPVMANALFGGVLSYLGGRFLGPVFSRFCGGGGGAVVEEGTETIARGIFNSVDDLPPVRSGFTRLYRGTGHPNIPQVSPSMRGVPSEQIPSGANNFMTLSQAQRHARDASYQAISDGVSSCQMLWK